jgi:hypothetical protein
MGTRALKGQNACKFIFAGKGWSQEKRREFMHNQAASGCLIARQTSQTMWLYIFKPKISSLQS